MKCGYVIRNVYIAAGSMSGQILTTGIGILADGY